MAEYIEREALVKRLKKEECDCEWLWDILDIPSADVAPVRHGQWIEQETYTFGTFYACSICDNRILDNGHSWNYCPNRGCRMDGGDNDG